MKGGMDKLFRLSLLLFALYPALVNQTLKGVVAAAVLLLQLLIWIRWRPQKTHQPPWFWVLLTIPVLGYVVSLTYTTDVALGVKYLERVIFWALFPWLLYLNRSLFTAALWKDIESAYMASTAGLTLYMLGRMTLSGFLWKAIQAPDSYFWIRTKMEQLSGLHPTYYAMMAAMALWMAILRWKTPTQPRRFQWAFAATIALLGLGLLLASSKIILLATALGLLFVVPQQPSPRVFVRTLGWIASIGLVVLLVVKPIRERAWTLAQAVQNEQVNENNPDSMRKGIWSCSWWLIQMHPTWGVGLGDFQAELNQCYTDQGYLLARERQFNTHNQYLQVWLAAGFLPFVAFLAMVLVQMALAWTNRNWLHVAFAAMMALVFLTENILERQDGVFFFAFFTAALAQLSWLPSATQHSINGKFLRQNLTGVQRYAQELAHHLTQGPFAIIAPPGFPRFVRNWGHKPGFLFIWEQVLLPVHLRLLGSPVLINLGNTAPLLYPRKVVVVHDVAPLAHPEWFSPRFSRWYGWSMRTMAQRSLKMATISRFSAAEMERTLGIPAPQIGWAPNGIPPLAVQAELPSIAQPYILSVGTLSDRKNQHQLIQAFLSAPLPGVQLVLAGNSSPDIAWSHQGLLEKALATGRVHWINQPSDAVLKGLYQNAAAFAYVSLYEGFGLPIAEALAHNLPCVVADIPVFREFFEGHVLFTDIGQPTALASSLEQILAERSVWVERATAFNPLNKGLDFKWTSQEIEGWVNRATALTSQAEIA
jgi:glycosyltransferase involved in cell wall biosynthesis/O-antigen ligase